MEYQFPGLFTVYRSFSWDERRKRPDGIRSAFRL